MNTGRCDPGLRTFSKNSEKLDMNTHIGISGACAWYNCRDAARMRRTAMEGMSIMLINLDTMTEDQFERYKTICNSRSAAEFRFRRECCGIELAEMAEDLDVRLDTVKRWENPKKGMPPSIRAWAYIDSAYASLLEAVEAAIQQVEDTADELGEPEVVHLSYRRGIMRTRDGETVGRANAATRAVGIALVALGYDVSVEWADEGAAGLAARTARAR